MEEKLPENRSAEEILDEILSLNPAERKARIETALRESHLDLIRTILEHKEALRELDKEKGILERLFGYRTSV